MIISLFMDEAPRMCGCSSRLAARSRVLQPGCARGLLRHDRGRDDEQGEHAESVHVSAIRKKAQA
jgi:hypothetical protein